MFIVTHLKIQKLSISQIKLMGEFTTLGYTIAHMAQDYLYIQMNTIIYVAMMIWYCLAFVSVSEADLTLVFMVLL